MGDVFDGLDYKHLTGQLKVRQCSMVWSIEVMLKCIQASPAHLAHTHTHACKHRHTTHRHTNIHVRGHARMLSHTQTDKQTTSKPSGIAKGHVSPPK